MALNDLLANGGSIKAAAGSRGHGKVGSGSKDLPPDLLNHSDTSEDDPEPKLEPGWDDPGWFTRARDAGIIEDGKILSDGLTRAEARGLVAALPNKLDLITIQKIIKAAKLPMSPGVGGAGRAGRTKEVVHDEMRAHLSLPTLFSTVPTGIAIPPAPDTSQAPPDLVVQPPPPPPTPNATEVASLEAGWSPEALSAAAALYDSASYPQPPVAHFPASPPPPPTIGAHISPPPTVQSVTNVSVVDGVVRRGDANFNLLSPIQQATYELRIDEKTGDTFYTFTFVRGLHSSSVIRATSNTRVPNIASTAPADAMLIGSDARGTLFWLWGNGDLYVTPPAGHSIQIDPATRCIMPMPLVEPPNRGHRCIKFMVGASILVNMLVAISIALSSSPASLATSLSAISLTRDARDGADAGRQFFKQLVCLIAVVMSNRTNRRCLLSLRLSLYNRLSQWGGGRRESQSIKFPPRYSERAAIPKSLANRHIFQYLICMLYPLSANRPLVNHYTADRLDCTHALLECIRRFEPPWVTTIVALRWFVLLVLDICLRALRVGTRYSIPLTDDDSTPRWWRRQRRPDPAGTKEWRQRWLTPLAMHEAGSARLAWATFIACKSLMSSLMLIAGVMRYVDPWHISIYCDTVLSWTMAATFHIAEYFWLQACCRARQPRTYARRTAASIYVASVILTAAVCSIVNSLTAISTDKVASVSSPPTPNIASLVLASVLPSPTGKVTRPGRRGHAKKAPSKKRAPRSNSPDAKGATTWRTAANVARWLRIVVDSGCTWHVHPLQEDLINQRPCNDTITNASGDDCACTCVGDLPLVVRDAHNREYRLLLRGVRCCPSFDDTLISVDQLWHTTKIDTIFRDERVLEFHHSKVNDGSLLRVPFQREGGLYRLHAAIAVASHRAGMAAIAEESGANGAKAKSTNSTSEAPKVKRAKAGISFSLTGMALKAGIHAGRSIAHLDKMHADDVAATLHRRLHIGMDLIKRLGHRASDAPEHVAHATTLACEHCAAANATRVSHNHSAYHPSHPGRLIHADIAGPFTDAAVGGARYLLLLTDDHTRFKFAYFLKHKSDAPARIRRFVASFNAHASTDKAAPVRIVGTLHSDNAGEFVSHEFREFLDEALIHQSTSPPHAHQLNGVSERGIRTVMSLARSYLVAGHVSVGYWNYAVASAVDVLNRTTGPTEAGHDGPSSYEMLTGVKPRIMSIMPFGCRAFAVKPRSQFAKTTIDPRAWVGIHLGRSSLSPGGYEILVPSIGRVVNTTDAYFMESVFPLRPKGERLDDIAPTPTSPPLDTSQPPGVPDMNVDAAPDAATSDAIADVDAANGWALISTVAASTSATTLSAAFEQATRGRGDSPKRVLLLFSGPYRRPDGLAALLTAKGFEVDQVDSDKLNGGGDNDNLLNDVVFTELHTKLRNGYYTAVFAAPPCSTYSIARYFKSKDSKDGGPEPVRSRSEILGLSDIKAPHRRELRQANEVTRRTCVLLSAARRSGAEIAIENPADRGDPSQPHLFQFPEHGPLWLDPHVITLISEASMRSATFAQCMFGGSTQKYTTFYFTAGFDSSFSPLNRLLCTHAPGTHGTVAGGGIVDGKWSSAATAAYPADLNLLIAEAILHLSTSTVTTAPDAPIRPPTEASAPVAPDAKLAATAADDAADDATDAGTATDDATPAPRGDPSSPLARRTAIARDAAAPPSGNRRRRQVRDVFQRGLGAVQTRSRGTAALARPSATDPANRPAAMVDDKPGWTKAEAKEIDNHQGNHSWSYIPLTQKPRDRRTVRLIWVYKTKRDGTKKARLCVQGCTQVPGVDYDQTFCAAMRGTSLRLLCALSARLKLKMRRWDFVAAYLQGELEEGEVVYCSPPTGYETKKLANGTVALCEKGDGDGVTRICKVEKPVYGMAQAGRRWQRSLFPWMLAWRCDAKGAKGCAHRPSPLNADTDATSAGTDVRPRLYQTDADSCVFYTEAMISTPSGTRHEYLFVGVYVDDLFILSSHDDEHSLYHYFTRDLAAAWDVEDEGEVDDLLSIEISSKDGHVSLTQTGYIEKLMKTYGPASGLPPSSHRQSATPCDHTLAQSVCDAPRTGNDRH